MQNAKGKEKTKNQRNAYAQIIIQKSQTTKWREKMIMINKI